MTVQSYPYDVPGNYTFDNVKIDVSGGLVTLKEDLTNLYARWHMNEATGATVIDSSGNGRDGVPNNSPPSVAGKLNTALSFNGTNRRANCGDIANFDRLTAFSVGVGLVIHRRQVRLLLCHGKRLVVLVGCFFLH